MPYTLLQGGRRRRRRSLPVFALVVLAAVAVLLLRPAGDEPAPRPIAPLPSSGPAPLAGGGTAPSPLAVRLADPRDVVEPEFRRAPRAALLFDLDTGRVLWRRAPTRVLPMASLTKLMTALLVADRLPRRSKVLIRKEALRYTGSGIGLLKRGRRIPVETMLHGLLLVSGNDAAIALAQQVSGSESAFVALMNERARAMGLTCTRFSTASGVEDRGNHSCAADLAALARAALREPRIARIARKRSAVLRFPVKGGRLFLYNTNPLLRAGYRGITGLKTGYTDAAGRCLVATARRGPVKLGVVLLDSPDPGRQGRRLLDLGFRASR